MKKVQGWCKVRYEDFLEDDHMSKHQIHLTKHDVQNYPRPEQGMLRLWDSEIEGLYVLIPAAGKRTAYFRYRIQGRQRDFRIGRIDRLSLKAIRDEAKKCAARVELGQDIQEARNAAKLALREAKNNQGAPNLQLFGDFYQHYYIDYAKATLKDYRKRLRAIEFNFSQWFDKRLDEINVPLVASWRNHKLATPVTVGKGDNQKQRERTTGAINRPVGYLKALLSVAYEEAELLDHHPLDRLKPLKEPRHKRDRFLTNEEFKRLRNSLRGRDDYLPVLIELGINTGLRLNEMLTLEWGSVDLRNQTLTVESHYAKSKRKRTVPLNNSITAVIRDWKLRTQRFGPWVFTNPNTDNHYVSIYRAWNTAMQEAGIENFVRHDLRRTFGSWLAERGESIYVIKNLLGHSSVKVTEESYAYLQDKSQRDAVERLEAIA